MIEFTINKEDVDRIAAKLEEISPQKRDGAIHKGMQRSCSDILAQLVSNVSGTVLRRRTGNLAKSMGYRMDVDNNGVPLGVIGSGASLKTTRMIYANIHETGGVIRPIRARMLTIPIGENLTPAGVARYTAREARQSFNSTFIKKSKNGNLILFGTRGKKLIPLFVLKSSVTIPARKYMSVTVDETKDVVVQDIIRSIEEAVQ